METLNKTLTRDIHVRNLSPEQVEKRQAEFVISTEAVDTYGTVFRAEGWDLTRFEKNPIVLYGHRSFDGNPDMIIGTGEVYREDKQLIGRVTFEDKDINPTAEKVFRKVQAGTLRMASIGANPTDAHWGSKESGEDPDVLYFDRQELLEFSIVPIGSNPDALKRNAETISEIKEKFTRNTEVQTTSTQKTSLSIREAQLIINKNNQ
jgi:HK97 family phage prohead protease